MKKRLLVVDDERVIRAIIRECLSPTHDVLEAEGPEEARRILQEDMPDVLVTDVHFPEGGGASLVRSALAAYPDLAVMVITGHGTIEEFLEFFRLGVAEYVLKPFTLSELRHAVARATETRRVRAENARLLAAAARTKPEDRFAGSSVLAREIRVKLAGVAATDSTVLITGASGTGKEVAARTIHELSQRARGPFVPVHCGALPEHLVEAELFGHARGAFTGAERSRPGRFEEAEGGTVLLDEIGTMTSAAQVRLLRVLQERQVTRVGDDAPRRIDVRVIAATNADLPALVRAKDFREDLYYRLEVFQIHLPSLAERQEDIPELAQRFLALACGKLGRPNLALSQGALRKLRDHEWPGNVRELENEMERAAILAGAGAAIEAEHVLGAEPPTIEIPDAGVDLPRLLSDLEEHYITLALARTNRNTQAAANLLGLQRTTLAQKLRRRKDGDANSPVIGEA